MGWRKRKGSGGMSMLKDKMQIDNKTMPKTIRSGEEINLSDKQFETISFKDWKECKMKDSEGKIIITPDMETSFKIQRMESEIKQLEKKLAVATEALEFYGDVDNWTRRDTYFWENIDRDDCADYPHFTRDVKLTGGKRARQALGKIKPETMKES